MIHITLLPGAALLAAGIAAAQAGPERPDPQANINRSQVIERVDQRFARLDADHDGGITREEMNQARAQRQARRGARMAEASPPSPGMRGPGHHGHGMRGHRLMRGQRVAMRMFGEQGFITRDQFRVHALERFDRADADHDGTLTAAERQAARPMIRMHHNPGGPGDPEGDDE